MNLNTQRARVQQAEQALQAQVLTSATRWQQLKHCWRESWTPSRIVIAGLAAGFAIGRARPLRLASSGGLLNLLRALAPLLDTASATEPAASTPPNTQNEQS
ncbi:MAG: hypothetical protein KUL77_03035 [Thermomonas sp.]|jgi:hypothetical protein|uniref:hypothetical protein n=1 Tax=Thermomonas sp. TaxID=1971895 RepID=UPI001EB89310|nr:hypothetical protein [Thermomonas sp.]MBV2208522.1 hypothetical protein [Thermomonas sp.]